jgi:hypothetical protein
MLPSPDLALVLLLLVWMLYFMRVRHACVTLGHAFWMQRGRSPQSSQLWTAMIYMTTNGVIWVISINGASQLDKPAVHSCMQG